MEPGFIAAMKPRTNEHGSNFFKIPHGGTKNIPHHATCHIHTATAERINNGLKPEGQIDITNEYSTIEDAIQFYVRRINLNIEDRQKHFPAPNGQMDLFPQIDDNI